MNDHEAQRIAAAMHAARPDWPASSVLTLIRKNLADRPRRDVFVALAWVASEPNTATPARVLESGPWWRAAGIEGAQTNRHPTPETACRNCGRELGPSCCEEPTRRTEPTATYTEHAKRARDLLRERKTNHEGEA